MAIHPTAIVSPKAQLAEGVSVGAFSIIGESVSIAENVQIGAYCIIEGNTRIGPSCQVFSGAVIGSRPQDLKYKGEKSYLEIGSNNIIREYCTFNPGTHEGGKTSIGNNNLFMAYSHVAHDCVIGDDCVIANNGTLAGHVTIENKAVIGGLVAVHQFVRIGTLSIIGGCSKVVKDIPPYSTCDGHPTRIYGLNLIGLRRNNVSRESIRQLGHAFRVLFDSGFSLQHALGLLAQEKGLSDEVMHLIGFVKESQRGLSRSCRS